MILCDAIQKTFWWLTKVPRAFVPFLESTQNSFMHLHIPSGNAPLLSVPQDSDRPSFGRSAPLQSLLREGTYAHVIAKNQYPVTLKTFSTGAKAVRQYLI